MSIGLKTKGGTIMTCTFCNEPSDELSTGSDGVTLACADCQAEADR